MLSNILMLIAGLGVFLFGIQTFSHNIEKVSSNKVRKEINKFSGNRFSGIGSGFLFTSLLQSSTAGIILIAGFTSAGLISLFQAFSLTLGSSMASAVPNFLISISSFNVKEIFCAFAVIGIFVLIFCKRPLGKSIGAAIVGFSLMFVGMILMGNSTSFFSTYSGFTTFFQTLTNPAILILLGIAFTIITQSALGTIAIIMTLVGTSTSLGVVSIDSAIFIMYGANIGSAIMTFFLISLSSNIDGKRIGLFHLLYITIGSIVFSLLSLTPWVDIIYGWVAEPALKLAFVNLTFNILTALFLIPLINPAIALMKKILPGKKSKRNPLEINQIQNESPSITLAKANEKILPFFEEVYSLYNRTVKFISEEDNSSYKKLYKDLSDYSFFINKYSMYVVRIATNDVYESVNKEIELLLSTIRQFERINKNCIKILPILNNRNEKIVFSQKLKKFIDDISLNNQKMLEMTKQFILDPTCKFLQKGSVNLCDKIVNLSQENSQTKLSAKSFIIGAGTKQNSEKSSIYIEFMSYLGLISNNILDLIFTIVGKANCAINLEYEQLNFDELNSNELYQVKEKNKTKKL